ncbi:MAG: hypothetical protein RIR18_980 [Pseudomonadota bacterium]|jgi:glyoxylase-like metal-dependent hydrolase (beta-lactamase superfamily II)
MRWNDYQNGIYAFDADYIRPLLSAIHLIVEEGKAAFVDTGTNDSLPLTLDALARVGLTPADVEYVILTHIHLDHAGGAGVMMQAFPNAKLVVHPRGTRHMIDPSKLLDGVRAVYGVEATAKLYGEPLPIPAERIIEATDGLTLNLGNRRLSCFETPGHARHHVCIVDEKTSGIFTGDMFGISYRETDVLVGEERRMFIFPTTSPSQFDRDEMHASIDKILSRNPEACYLTHYARVTPVPELGAKLHEMVDAYCNIVLQAEGTGESRHQAVVEGLTQYLINEVRQHGCTLSDAELVELLGTDIELDAQGLEIWADQLDKSASS